MQITKLTTQVKNPERVSLYVDGRFFRGLDKLVAMRLGLKPGLTLTPTLVQRLEEHQTQSNAWETALRSVAHSPKSTAVMRRKLLQKFPAAIVTETITRLVEGQILNDSALASHLANHYSAGGHRSRKQIWALLKTKQLSDPDIRSALDQLDGTHELQAAQRLADKKNHQWRALAWADRYQKIAGYLAQRGFPYAIIKQVVTKDSLETQ